MLTERHRALTAATEYALKETAEFNGLAADILTAVTDQTLRTYQQKINVGVQDAVADLIETFKHRIAEAVFDAGRGWRLANRDPFPFPRGCRFCFAKGGSTVVVVEQDPEVRTLLFDPGLDGSERRPPAGEGERIAIALALPYVVFVLQFKADAFANLYCGWRTSPLSTLDDLLTAPVLPNIRDTLHVCVGAGQTVAGTTIAEQTASVLGNFWNSRFNNDLSARWWAKPDIDRRLRSAREWARHSREDATFILNVNFPYTADRSVRRTVDLLTAHEDEPDENALRHRLADAIDSSVAGLFAKILRYFKKTKFERHHPKDVTAALARAMRDASGEVVDLLRAVEHELAALKRDVAAERRKDRPVPFGPHWADYSP